MDLAHWEIRRASLMELNGGDVLYSERIFGLSFPAFE